MVPQTHGCLARGRGRAALMANVANGPFQWPPNKTTAILLNTLFDPDRKVIYLKAIPHRASRRTRPLFDLEVSPDVKAMALVETKLKRRFCAIKIEILH